MQLRRGAVATPARLVRLGRGEGEHERDGVGAGVTPREEKLSAGFGAALDALVVSDGLVRGLLHIVAMLLAMRHRDARFEDARRELVGAHLRSQELRLRAYRGALDKAADRAVLAELRLERARAALPALRAAAEGRSRDAVRAAVEQVAAALGEGAAGKERAA